MRVIAVDGPSGAGKSTYAARLAAVLGAPTVGTDEFPVPWDGEVLAWWPPVRRLLGALADGRPAVYRPYDWRSGSFLAPRTLRPPHVLLLEGVGTAWAGTPAALRIWVDAPAPLRRARAARRDGEGSLPAWDSWALAEARHFAADRTRERADLLVEGSELVGDLAQRRREHLGRLSS